MSDGPDGRGRRKPGDEFNRPSSRDGRGTPRDKSQDRQNNSNPRFAPKCDRGGDDVRRGTGYSSPPPEGQNGGRDMDDRRFGNDHLEMMVPPPSGGKMYHHSHSLPRNHYDDNRVNQEFDSRRNEGGRFGDGGLRQMQEYGERNEEYGLSNGGFGNDNRYDERRDDDRNGRFDDRGGNRGFERNSCGGESGFPQNNIRGRGGGFNQSDRGYNCGDGGFSRNFGGFNTGGGSGFHQNDNRDFGRGFNQRDRGSNGCGGGFRRNDGRFNSGGRFSGGGGSGFHQNDNRDGVRGFNQNDREFNGGGGGFSQNFEGFNSGGRFSGGRGSGFHQYDNRDAGRGFNQNDRGFDGGRGGSWQINNRSGGGGFDHNSGFKSGGGSSFDNHDSGFGNRNDNFSGSRFNNDGGFENHQRGSELGKERAPKEWMPEVIPVEEMTKQMADNAQDLKIEEDQSLEIRNSDISQQLTSWENSGLHPTILRNIAQCGYKDVRAIQAAVVPQLMAGYDLLGQAETGGGKTAAFALPIIHKIMEIPEEERERAGTECSPYCFILSPVREIAKQTSEVLNSYAEGTGVKVQLTYGETNRWDCLNKIRQGCHILVGTCGRIMDYLERGEITFSNLKFFVLDEADRLLEDMTRGGGDHLETIVNNRKFKKSTGTRQTLLFSATFNSIVENVARNMMKPLPGQIDIVRIVMAQGRINPRVHLHFFETNDVRDKMVKLKELTAKTDTRYPRTLIFVEQKKRTDYVALEFEKSDFKAESINGDRPQNVREQILKRFRTGETDVLIGTDVCSRGLDIPDLERVINFDLPKASVGSATDTFINRVGRCGRLKRGDAYSFVNPDYDNDRQLIPALVELVKTLKREDTLPEFMKDAGSSYRPTNNLSNTANTDTKDEDEKNDGREKKEKNDVVNGESAKDDKEDDDDEESEW